MGALLNVVLPVFLVVGFGYGAVWRGWFSTEASNTLMRFAQNFAIPCFLFSAMATLDLGAGFDPRLLGSYYGGVVVMLLLGFWGARILFNRPWPDCVAIGVAVMYPNSVLLGLPITERAYGLDALTGNFAIIAFHSPVCYILGITFMEFVRAEGQGAMGLARSVATELIHNPLIIAILLGVTVNLTGLPLPAPVWEALGLVTAAALPAALFALGGILYVYRPEGDLWTIAFIVFLSLFVHPAVVMGFGTLSGLEAAGLRSAVITASVASGINTFLFANLYGVAKRVVASSVLLGTGLSVVSVWIWLAILP